MQDRFESVLEAHAARYPAMMPQDYGKLAYQHVFGPEHLVEDAQAVDRLLQEEWETLRPDPDGVFRAEPIGNGLCRLHLAGPWDPAAGKLLGELFCRTAPGAFRHGGGAGRAIGSAAKLPGPRYAGLAGGLQGPQAARQSTTVSRSERPIIPTIAFWRRTTPITFRRCWHFTGSWRKKAAS